MEVCEQKLLTRTKGTHLKNRVGSSLHLREVDPDRFTTCICTSSMISTAPTGTPARMTCVAALAAALMVGNVTTATLVSCGSTASFKVASVTIPKVPSDPTNKAVRL